MTAIEIIDNKIKELNESLSNKYREHMGMDSITKSKDTTMLELQAEVVKIDYAIDILKGLRAEILKNNL